MNDREKAIELAKKRIAEYDEYGAIGVSIPDTYILAQALLAAEEELKEAEEVIRYYADEQEWIDFRATGVHRGEVLPVDSKFDHDENGKRAREWLEKRKDTK